MLLSACILCLVMTWTSGAPGPDPDINVEININVNGFDEDGSGNGGKDGSSRPYCENCGKGGSKNRIVGGTPAGSAKKWPWQTLLYTYDNSGAGYICGGSIIKKGWILTAAHCFNGIVKLEVYLGVYNQSNVSGALLITYDGEDAVNKAVFIHKDYNTSTFDNDIALIKLEEDLEFKDTIQPVCLAYNEDIIINGSAVATGWGTTSSGGADSDSLLQVTLENIDTVRCREMYQSTDIPVNSRAPITENQICTLKPDKDSCQGDSGGPLVAQLKDGSWVQIGVVSFGYGCALSIAPGVYTKVPNYITWITQITGSNTC